MFKSLDEKSKALVRAAYVNGITLLLSAVGDPLILLAFILYAFNVGAVLIICYYTFGERIENVWYSFKEKIFK